MDSGDLDETAALYSSQRGWRLGLLTGRAGRAHDNSRARFIRANYNGVRGPRSKVFKRSSSAGHANEGLRANWRQQLAMQQQVRCEYMRMNGLHDDMGV